VNRINADERKGKTVAEFEANIKELELATKAGNGKPEKANVYKGQRL
jgi:hypothetical protein